MWSVLRSNPVRTVITLSYLLFVTFYICLGFLPARAADTPITGHLFIPTADISLDVTPSVLDGKDLSVPDQIISSYSQNPGKTLLMAHSATGFANLPQADIGDIVWYAGTRYRIISKSLQKVSDIDMRTLLAPATTDTLILMTCAGERIGWNDYDSRLILQAETF